MASVGVRAATWKRWFPQSCLLRPERPSRGPADRGRDQPAVRPAGRPGRPRRRWTGCSVMTGHPSDAKSPLPPSAAVAVIGAGTMGSGIASVAAAAGHPVLPYDADPAALERGI